MKRELTFAESTCVVAGNGIGGGMMAIPYLFGKVGLIPALCVMLAAWAVSAVLHIMVADMLLKSHSGGQILAVFRQFLFRGRFVKQLTALFFVILAVVLFANLSAYIAGGADIIVFLTGLPVTAACAVFFLFAAVPVFFGLKVIGIGERAMVTVIVAVTALLALLSVPRTSGPLPLLGGGTADLLGLYAMVMFSLSALFSAPQAVEGLRHQKQLIGRAIALGLFLNLALTVVSCISVAAVSQTITPVAIVGWSSALGGSVQILASLFVLLAMLTSYWAISLALSDIVREQLHLRHTPCWLVGTVPSLVLAAFSGAGFTDYIQVAGGAVAVIIALLVVPAYRVAVKSESPYLLGRAGQSRALLLAVVGCYLLMAVGSFL